MKSDGNSPDSKNNQKIIIVIGLFLSLLIIVLVILNPFKHLDGQQATSETDSRLASELQTEEKTITDAFNQRFSFLQDEYEIKKVVLLDNNFAAVLLSHRSTTYRALMVKRDEKWLVEGLPSAVLLYDDFANISKDVIQTINNLEVNE